MARHTERRTYLSQDITWQLKTLFGTGTNAHARLGLHEIVPRIELQKGLAGHPIRSDHERIITQRWGEWRRKFLAPPEASIIHAERVARQAGDYFDSDGRDLVSERLLSDAQRFTLLPDAGKYL